MLFLHGILGSGANWRTFAKQVVAADPTWGAVLVDLRLHGESQAGFLAPHTIEAAARDVAELIEEIEARTSAPVRSLLAHSFGGKVALELARLRSGDLDHLFVVDSTPSARPDAKGSESTRHIVELLTELPSEFPDRAAFTAWIEARGVSRPTAMWLAMNVRPLPNTTRFVFRIDLPGIRALLADYFRVDLWDVLERPRGPMQAHLIVGGRSGVVDAEDRERAARCPQTTLDVIEEADHWVHVDAPDALRAIVLRYLAS
jgi:pimeloyl-ACP methyl ester carboxylesterase